MSAANAIVPLPGTLSSQLDGLLSRPHGPLLLALPAALASHALFRAREPTLFGFLLALAASALLLPPFLFLSLNRALLPSLALTLNLLAGYLSSLLLSVAVYRLSPLHPLASFPGPVLARLSKFWGVRAVAGGHVYEIVRDLHDKYGDVVRVGPNELSVRNAGAIHPIYGSGGFHKGPFYDAFMRPKGAKPMFVLRSHRDHADRRKVYDRAFQPVNLRNYTDKLVPEVERFVDRIGKTAKEGEGKVDMTAWFGFLAYDFMGQLLFGHAFGMLDAGVDSFGYWPVLESAMQMFVLFGQVPWLTPISRVLPVPHDQKRFQAKAIELVDTRTKEGAQHKDLFYHLMGEGREAGDPELHPFSVLAELNNMMIAGSETSDSALCFTLYYLLLDPERMAALLKELDAAFPPSEPFPFDGDLVALFDRLARLPYLNGCLSEGMRLIPPVPNGLQRTSPPEGASLAGVYVPGGQQVSIPIYTLHRDERWFSPLPDEFRPERWTEAGKWRTNKLAFMAFSYGPYGCVGKHLAWHEMRLALAALLHRFELEFQPDWDRSEYPRTVREIFGLAKGRLPVLVKERTAGKP